MEEYHAGSISEKETRSARKLIGTHVLTPKGAVVGKIVDVHLDLDKLKVFGISVKPSLFKKPVYIGADYIARLSLLGSKLIITPTFLLLGKKVITNDGRILGSVVGVHRKEPTVSINELCVKRYYFLKRYLPYNAVKKEGKNILLGISYDEAKKQLTKQAPK